MDNLPQDLPQIEIHLTPEEAKKLTKIVNSYNDILKAKIVGYFIIRANEGRLTLVDYMEWCDIAAGRG